jgi:AcrR family transcriptional regulator
MLEDLRGDTLRYPRAVVSLPDHLKPIAAGQRKLAREVMEEHQRARILEGAIDVLAAKGYPATTVDDFVAAARIGVGSFYAHFNGKEECLLAAFELVAEEARRAILPLAATGESWATQVCLGLRELLRWIAANPSRARIVLVEIQTGGSRALDRYEQTLDAAATFLRAGRELADPSRHLPGTLEETTAGGIAWLLRHRLSADEPLEVEALFADLGAMVLEPYLGEEAARREIAARVLAPSS